MTRSSVTRRFAAARGLVALSLVLCSVVVLPGMASAAVKVAVPCRGTRGGATGLITAIQRANADGGGAVSLATGCTYTLSAARFGNGLGATGLPLIAAKIAITGQRSTIARAKSAKEFRLLQLASDRSAALSLSGLTLRGGDVSTTIGRNGGAILAAQRGSLVVRHCTLLDNAAVNGGAIDAGGAQVTIVGSRLRENRAVVADGVGGAILQVGGPLTIESSVITQNQSTGGGGGVSGQSIGVSAQLLRISDTTISNNTTLENGGGGVFAFGPERTVIIRSAIVDNTFAGVRQAGAGGGIFNGGHMTMTASTIAGNTAGGRRVPESAAGGIFNASGATGAITASTIAGNRALGPGASGGGIVNGSGLTLTATIVSGNQAGNCVDRVRDGGFNLEVGHSCGFTRQALHANPRLGPLAANGGPTPTMALRPASPAINRIPPKRASCRRGVDQRGVPRPQGPRCDIGAFEVVATRTALRVRALGGAGKRVRLIARVSPSVALPGAPQGVVVFRDGGRVLGRRRLAGRKAAEASIVVRLNGGRRRLTASYEGSMLFLPSVARSR